jgi:hypothetical protein
MAVTITERVISEGICPFCGEAVKMKEFDSGILKVSGFWSHANGDFIMDDGRCGEKNG